MKQSYVRTGERVLFALALVFSILVYALLIAGAAAAVSAGAEIFRSAEYGADEYGADDYAGDGQAYPVPTDEEYPAEEYYDEEYFDEEYAEDEYYEDYEGYDEAAFEEFSTRAAMAGLASTAAVIVLYLILIVAFVLGAHILMVGHLMGNGVRVNERQFPELWKLFGEAALQLGIKKLPAFYLVESGGLLNAFATRLFTRSYVAIYADLAERLYEGDADSVAFVVAHELVHVRRSHMLKNLLTLPAEAVPFLKSAWRRACEYGCDAGGALYAPAGAESGLKLLAAGKKLSSRMDADAYLEAFSAERSLWKRLAELASSHPHLPKRIAAVRAFLGRS